MAQAVEESFKLKCEITKLQFTSNAAPLLVNGGQGVAK